MTLKEKFNNLDSCVLLHNSRECEKIADDYAIEFAEFLYDCALNETLDNKSLEKLLEIFKKEKGL